MLVFFLTQSMEAEANDTLTVRTTLVNVNCTLQEIQEQSVRFLALLDSSPPSLTSYSRTTSYQSLTAGLPPGKHYGTADNHTEHLCESEID